MEISIIGLPGSGKTTIFNALTRGKSDAASSSSSFIAPNIGVTKVPEPRINLLESIFKPKKIVIAEIKYVDIGGMSKTTARKEGIYGPYLNYLINADALLHIVRNFTDINIPVTENSINPQRDMTNMDLELIFSDLSIIEKRLIKIEENLKGAKSAERDHVLKEQSLLKKIKDGLEKDIPLWKQQLTIEESKSLANYQFLTAKSMLVIVNIDEKQVSSSAAIENELRRVYSFEKFEIIALCGKLEMELAQLNENEALEFRASLGLNQSAIDKIISASYHLLGLISFFTTASSELKVWTIPQGTTALKAAGKIHTDMEKGFIKAEVMSFIDLEKYRTVTEVKRNGLLRLEGKNYIIQDGDIITFLFNI
jgi:GTP-binding protein YchF